MAALTTIETELIDNTNPIRNQFSVGSRVRYLTTAGAFSSGIVQGCVIKSYAPTVPASTIESTAITTALAITGGFNSWRASGGSNVRIATGLDDGTVVTVINQSTGDSGVITLSTAGTVGVMGGTFGATDGSSACYVTLAGMQTWSGIYSSGTWYPIYGTGSMATFSTTLTAS